MPKIVFENVSIKYLNKNHFVTVSKDLNLTFLDKKINVIVGASGSGKTSILKCLIDQVDYDGKILLDGSDIQDVALQKRNISYVSQNYALYPTMTIFDNIAFPLKLQKLSVDEIRNRVYEECVALDLMDTLSRKPRHISGGQQQRVCLARALIKKPVLCLLDEPLSNIDANAQLKARLLIHKQLKERQITSIYVTHNIQEAVSLADKITLIDQGKVLFDGNPKDFLKLDNEIVKTYLEEEKIKY